jgi:hypothetical protein
VEPKLFNEILVLWKDKEINWDDKTAEKYGYSSGEALRSSFRRERKKRGITRETMSVSVEKSIAQLPNIGILDIETLPMVVYTFAMFDQNIGTEQVIREVSLLSWAGKFLNDSKVYSDILTPDEIFKQDEERIVKSCWNFMNKCNIIVGHNLISFDGKLMNTFFLKYGLPPLKYVSVDTLLVAKSNFRFSSNSLSFINRQLGIRDKISNDGFVLWRRCFEGDTKALNEMLDYNIGDISATEELFYRLRPYVKNINIALYNDSLESQCPSCGETRVTITGKTYPTSAGLYEELRCDTCGALSRRKQNLLSLEKRKSLLINS